MRSLKSAIAVWLMLMAMKLVLVKNDARSLRTGIPLTLAMLNEMESVAPTKLKPMQKAFRDTLAKMRAKLAVLEGQDATLGAA